MKKGRSLSDFWRCDRSDDPALELTSVLEGADLLIGNMGSDIRVIWSGAEVSYTDFQQRIVALDYGPLTGEGSPVPGTAVDEVIGYAAHEGGHCLWSLPGKDQAIRRAMAARWNSLPEALKRDWQADQPSVLRELCRIQNVLEDAYTDHQVAQRWPVLGEYIHIARSRLRERTPIDLAAIAGAACPDRNAVINLWLSASAYAEPLPGHLSAPVKRAMDRLLDLTRRATQERDGVARQEMAVDAAAVLWAEFPVKEAAPPLLPQLSASASQSASGQEPEAGAQRHTPSQGGETSRVGNLDDFDPAPGPGEPGRKVVPVPQKLLERVAEVRAGQVEVLSQPVAQTLAEDPRRVVASARKGRYDPEHAARVISQVQPEIGEIKQAFRQQHLLNSRWLHGLDRGKLDDRRLWKPLVGDPGCYKRQVVAGRPGLGVGLLLDVSGSMSGSIPVVEQTAAVFFEGLRHMSGIDFAAWCYTGQAAQVALTQICGHHLPGLCLAGVDKGGGTPSGAALAGVMLLMERMPQKKRLLIHFTDGRPDSDVHVIRAIAACRAAAIEPYAISLSRHRALLSRQYGEGNYETIEGVSELPQAVARIVKRLGSSQR